MGSVACESDEEKIDANSLAGGRTFDGRWWHFCAKSICSHHSELIFTGVNSLARFEYI
jgi:hypothetical protein